MAIFPYSERKQKMTTRMRPIPDYGEHMSLTFFVAECQSGFFMDSDGHGYYATQTEMTELPAIPSRICQGKILWKYSHVVWFGK